MNGCGRFTGTTIRTSPRNRAVEGQDVHDINGDRVFDHSVRVASIDGLHLPGNNHLLAYSIEPDRSGAGIRHHFGGFFHIQRTGDGICGNPGAAVNFRKEAGIGRG